MHIGIDEALLRMAVLAEPPLQRKSEGAEQATYTVIAGIGQRFELGSVPSPP